MSKKEKTFATKIFINNEASLEGSNVKKKG